MTTRHTPEPWTCNEHGEIKDARGRIVAIVSRVSEDADENVSNGLLIALAPEMKAEIVAAMAEHEGEQNMGGSCPCGLCDRRRALLARLKG